MEEVSIYTKAKLYDPTHTTALRNAWVRDMNRRFNELTKVIKEAVVDSDCFYLNKGSMLSQQMIPPQYREFGYMRDPEKIIAFMLWLQAQVEKGILTVSQFQQIGSVLGVTWTDMYVYDAFKRGILRARDEMIKAGMNVSKIDDINVLLSMPAYRDRVSMMYTRTFNELKNITSAMSLQISKVLTQGLIDGDSPKILARKLIATINGDGIDRLGITDTLGRFIPAQRRAEVLARTEIIRTHHLANVMEYRSWGVEGITVLGEWRTAQDERVCEKCASMEGKIFTLDEIEPMIPLHPNCRCIALPWIEELQKYR